MRKYVLFLAVTIVTTHPLLSLTSQQLKDYSDFAKSDAYTWTQEAVDTIMQSLDRNIAKAKKPGTLHNYRNQIVKKWQNQMTVRAQMPSTTVTPQSAMPIPTTPAMPAAPATAPLQPLPRLTDIELQSTPPQTPFPATIGQPRPTSPEIPVEAETPIAPQPTLHATQLAPTETPAVPSPSALPDPNEAEAHAAGLELS